MDYGELPIEDFTHQLLNAVKLINTAAWVIVVLLIVVIGVIT